ncbi:MAG: hypothetical protein H8D24_07155 [Gammaproteobacteria bacterium]|uniref:Lipoprotein SmpA/OmlA domain-containing protein n=1 Tax=Candidatus Thiopontia autotrophica TaxID=2841688 RepID=A0A8J6P972_9GAMM|nr:hypothetical protein [Candidatus Thiopontia autotrophica]MBL6968599.1 hypothetical protein [Gammaproteobacteria bacterium]
MKTVIAIICSLFVYQSAYANDASISDRVTALENRISELEDQLRDSIGKNRWKDDVLWQRVKKDMTSRSIKSLLGKPGRIEESIFTTWYYHPTSKLYAFVWFDEDKVLGWKGPE